MAATETVSFIVRLEREGEKLYITTQNIRTRVQKEHATLAELCTELERSLSAQQ